MRGQRVLEMEVRRSRVSGTCVKAGNGGASQAMVQGDVSGQPSGEAAGAKALRRGPTW